MGDKSGKSFMISGYYGFGNAGDEAILAAIIQQLRRGFENPEIIVLSETPDDTYREYGVKSHNRKDFGGIFRLMGDVDMLISGGGGLIQDSTGLATVIYYLGIIEMAILQGKKVMLYSQGLGPIQGRLSRILTRNIVNRVDLITFRDEKSKKLALDIGIKKQIHITADPVFALEPAGREEVESAWSKQNPQSTADSSGNESFNLGISVRPWESEIDYPEMISRVVGKFINTVNGRVYLFPFQESQDMETCRALADKIGRKAILVPRNYPIPVMLGLIGKMDMLMGMRLHSLIFSALQNVPCAGISYDPKVANLMDILGLPCLKLENADENGLWEICNRVYEKRSAIKSTLPEKCAGLRKKADENINLIKEMPGMA